jgi:hypothetical protein
MTPAVVHVWMFCGYAGSGKTHAAVVLRDQLSAIDADAVFTTAFADAVKDDVAARYNLPRSMFDTQEGKATRVTTPDGAHTTARGLLIEYSLAMKEARGEDVWAREVVRRINVAIERNQAVRHVIIHDWRYAVELAAIQRDLPPPFVLHTIRIVRPSVASMPIPSEHDLDGFACSLCISNTGSVDAFEAAVRGAAAAAGV